SSLTGTYLSYAHPLKPGQAVFGAGFRSYDVSNLLSEHTYLVGGASRLAVEPFGMRGVWSVGANVKMFERSFKTDGYAGNAISNGGSGSGLRDPLFASGTRATAFGLDAGAMYQFGPALNTTLGATILNLNQPSIGIASTDKIPAVLKLGVAHRPTWGLLTAELRTAQRLEGKSDTDLAIGLERNFRLAGRSALSVRAGYASGSRGYKAVTAGASYTYDRFSFDYAFSFPIANLADTGGEQRLGVSYRFGGHDARSAGGGDPYRSLELLESFSHDSLAAHFLMTRTTGLTPDERSLADRLVARRFPLDDPGLAKASPELHEAMKADRDWNDTMVRFARGLTNDDLPHMLAAVAAYASGDSRGALARLALLSAEGQRRPLSVALQMLALGEESARNFRAGNLLACIDHVRRAADLAPTSDVIQRGLKALLAMRGHQDTVAQSSATFNASTDLSGPAETAPAAPALTPATVPAAPVETPVTSAPAASTGPASSAPIATEVAPVAVQAAAPSAVPASSAATAPRPTPEKPVVVPAAVVLPPVAPQPAALSAAPAPSAGIAPEKPVAAPAAKPAAKKPVTPKPAAPKPATSKTRALAPATAAPSSGRHATTPEAAKAWKFYDEAVSREVSDAERIEILQSMLMRFGEAEASRINEELARLRKRAARSSAR
ncbi:MAG: hypothetical protein JO102_07935, partial [Elusimicrobia bacterium]|nr:hypothetical protein [Elusimicrobiota bacterium]